MIRDILLVCAGVVFGYFIAKVPLLPGLAVVLDYTVVWLKKLFNKE